MKIISKKVQLINFINLRIVKLQYKAKYFQSKLLMLVFSVILVYYSKIPRVKENWISHKFNQNLNLKPKHVNIVQLKAEQRN